MSAEHFSNQSHSDAFDRNLEAQRINEVKADLGYPVEEIAGIPPQPRTPEEQANLDKWDTFIADITPKLQADHDKAHEIKPWEFRQFNSDHE